MSKCRRTVNIIGMGPGAGTLLSEETVSVLDSADLLVGAKRVIEIYPKYETKDSYLSYRADEIVEYIINNPQYKNIALMYSGDVGFYSGAYRIKELLGLCGTCNATAGSRENNTLKHSGDNCACDVFEVNILPGLSAPVYLMDKLGLSWDDAELVSNHGRTENLIPLIRENRKVCTLLGDADTVSEICGKLAYYGLSDVVVAVGERLSYEEEKITTMMAGDMAGRQFDKLSVALFLNENVRQKRIAPGIFDDEFIRGNVPMTKQEIRALVISKLHLREASVLYDIGAGTGSVSIEAALLMGEGQVYAIEKNEEAAGLIEENKKKFIADNVEVIKGYAPDAMMELPAPTHAFIGGSSGNMEEIIRGLINKNPSVRCVISAVTLETIAELDRLYDSFEECRDMEVVQVSVSRGKMAGRYHLMQAENSIYIASFGGESK